MPCAGSSERMGEAKALLRVGDRTFVQAVVQALTDGGCDPVIVVVPDDDAIHAAARKTGATVLTNADPGEGPITSLRLALAALDDTVDGILYLPVDHPMVRPETVAQLLTMAASSDAPLVIPTYSGERGHPGYFGSSLFAQLADPHLEGGARTVVRGRLEDAELVVVEDPGVLKDIDTPEAYATAIAEWSSGA